MSGDELSAHRYSTDIDYSVILKSSQRGQRLNGPEGMEAKVVIVFKSTKIGYLTNWCVSFVV